MTLGYVLSLCCNLNEIRVFWHFTSFPNRVLACPSQDAHRGVRRRELGVSTSHNMISVRYWLKFRVQLYRTVPYRAGS